MPRQLMPFFRKQKNAWYARVNGRVVSLRVTGRSNQLAAIRAWNELLFKVEGNAEGSTNKPIKTVADLVEEYLLEAKDRVSAKSMQYYTRFMRPFAGEYGHYASTAIKAPEIIAFANKPTWCDTTRHDAITTIASLFRWAEIPIGKLRKPHKRSKGVESLIRPEDAERIIALGRGDFRYCLELMWLTGCRPSEALGLQAHMIDLENSVIILRNHKTAGATGRPRLIYLAPRAKEILENQLRKWSTGFVFRTSNNRPITLNNAVNKLWRINRRLGTKATLYGFRHTYATEALAKGLPDAHVAELLGHTSTKMLHCHYSHLGAKASLMRQAASLVRPTSTD